MSEPVGPCLTAAIDFFGTWSDTSRVLQLGNGGGKTALFQALLHAEATRSTLHLATHGSAEDSRGWLLLHDDGVSKLEKTLDSPAFPLADLLDSQCSDAPSRILDRAGEGRRSTPGPVVGSAAEAVAHRPVGDVLSVFPIVPSAVASVLARVCVGHPPRLVRDALEGLLRFLNGIVASLSLLLVLLLAALSRLVNVVVFVLMVIAVCLRYGRRQDSPSHAFLLIRRFDPSAGTRAGSLSSAC